MKFRSDRLKLNGLSLKFVDMMNAPKSWLEKTDEVRNWGSLESLQKVNAASAFSRGLGAVAPARHRPAATGSRHAAAQPKSAGWPGIWGSHLRAFRWQRPAVL
jgi:hypothetical protein